MQNLPGKKPARYEEHRAAALVSALRATR